MVRGLPRLLFIQPVSSACCLLALLLLSPCRSSRLPPVGQPVPCKCLLRFETMHGSELNKRGSKFASQRRRARVDSQGRSKRKELKLYFPLPMGMTKGVGSLAPSHVCHVRTHYVNGWSRIFTVFGGDVNKVYNKKNSWSIPHSLNSVL